MYVCTYTYILLKIRHKVWSIKKYGGTVIHHKCNIMAE